MVGNSSQRSDLIVFLLADVLFWVHFSAHLQVEELCELLSQEVYVQNYNKILDDTGLGGLKINFKPAQKKKEKGKMQEEKKKEDRKVTKTPPKQTKKATSTKPKDEQMELR